MADNEQTSTNKYIATPAEQKLIETLANPENYGKNITELCELAGISRFTYYEAFKKPDFVAYYNSLVLELLRGKVGDVINATYRFATMFPQNHQDRKILLEMTGTYTPKQAHEVFGKDGGPIKYDMEIQRLDDDELLAAIERTADEIKELQKRIIPQG